MKALRLPRSVNERKASASPSISGPDVPGSACTARWATRVSHCGVIVAAIRRAKAVPGRAAAHALGLRVPDDLSVVGYNDIPVVSRLPVPLTTVRVPFPQIAANALELLREAGNDNPPRALVAAPTLIPRKSAAPPT